MQRQIVSSGSPFEATIGFSRALRVGPHVSGLLDPRWKMEIEAEALIGGGG